MQQYKNNMQLASYFQSAIYEGRLRLAYQPVISSKNGQIKSYEALLRVVTEDNRLVTAGPFIPVAEKLNLINQVDNMVLKLVVEELKNSPDISLAMNLSSLSIEDGEWLANAKNLLKDNDIASRLIVEITETSMQKDLNKVANFVESMQRLGCKIAIDDFGAGYTSFSQLKVVDADIIKIDGIFVRDIVDNYNSRMFVKTLIEFARGFGLETVAEFVESGDIAKVLMELGVDYMQGHYFSPAVNYRGWLTNQ
jgi:EAL domain-containing protein (putative c-di-GMP-specific phosphodiesterase class I)